MKIEVRKYRFNFKFDAGTSRGVMTSKDSWFIKLYDYENPGVCGVGECGPLKGLSVDLKGDLEGAIKNCQNALSDESNWSVNQIDQFIPIEYPALHFAFETALMDFKNKGKRILYYNDFTNSNSAIPINGLVWMGKKDVMLSRIKNKIQEGFTCIKIKIGAINFGDELNLLTYIRSKFDSNQITIRLDANGAFLPDKALTILEQLSKYKIHSVEQPIGAGDWDAMRKICTESPIPIALDEELVGINGSERKSQLLDHINPAFIILKPTLVGGLKQSQEWIDLASNRGIGWWITSALESNIGLNAIAQFTANHHIDIPQGLGTGQLFSNNISSPLAIKNGTLIHDNHAGWDLSTLD